MIKSEIDQRINEIADYDYQLAKFRKAIELSQTGNRPFLDPGFKAHLEKLIAEHEREKAKSQLILDALEALVAADYVYQ